MTKSFNTNWFSIKVLYIIEISDNWISNKGLYIIEISDNTKINHSNKNKDFS